MFSVKITIQKKFGISKVAHVEYLYDTAEHHDNYNVGRWQDLNQLINDSQKSQN